MKKILFICVVVVLASCNASKKATQKAPSANDTMDIMKESATTVLSKLNKIDFNTFSGKVDVDFDDGKGNAKSVNVKLIIKKDEVIWMSAGLMGFEGVRGIITKDSVKILNKLQKEYIATSLSYIQDKIGLPVDYATLQDLLIGNAVFVNTHNASISNDNGHYIINTQNADFKNLLTILMPGYLPSVSMLTDIDVSKNRSAELNYKNYKIIGERNFSTLRDIKVNYKSNIKLRLDFKSYNFDEEVSTPFSVPSGYKIK